MISDEGYSRILYRFNSRFATGTSIKSSEAKLVLWTHSSLLLREMMRSHVIKMATFTQSDEQRCYNERYNCESMHNIFYLRDREVVMYSVSSREPMTLTSI